MIHGAPGGAKPARPGTVSPNRLLFRFERLLFGVSRLTQGYPPNGNARQQEQEHWGSEPAER